MSTITQYKSCAMCAGNVQRSNVIYATTMHQMASARPDAMQWFVMDRAGSRVPYLLAGALEGSDLKAMGNIFGAAGKMKIRGYDDSIVMDTLALFKTSLADFAANFGQLPVDKQIEARRAFMALRPYVHAEAYRRTCNALEQEGIDSKFIPTDFNNALDTSKRYQLIVTAEPALAKNVRERYYSGAATGMVAPVLQFTPHPENYSVEVTTLDTIVDTPTIIGVGDLPTLVGEIPKEGSIWKPISLLKDNVAATVDEMRATVRMFKEASPEMVRILVQYVDMTRIG